MPPKMQVETLNLHDTRFVIVLLRDLIRSWCVKQIVSKLTVVCLTAGAVSSCAWISLDGDSSPHSKKVLSVAVPADPIPAATKPLPIPPLIRESPRQQPRKLPRQVEQSLLPQQSPVPEKPAPVIPLGSPRPAGVNSIYESHDSTLETVADQSALVYDQTHVTEDVTWRGTVIVRGYVVVAPQATLRLEPGTVVRFAKSAVGGGSLPRLVVQGRIQASGTAELPIVLTSGRSRPARGDWGGILLVSSEKRNTLEQCRIEFASAGIESLFSTIALKDVSISGSRTGLLMRDSVVLISAGKITESETAIESHDSELEMRDAVLSACQSGIIMNRTAAALSSLKIIDNQLIGIAAEECRVKISSGILSRNGAGARFTGGEGQITGTRFSGNRLTALQLAAARIKLQRCSFTDNRQDALRLEDGRALIWGNVFSGNAGYNLYNAGHETVAALQNWWGSAERSAITEKIHDAARDPHSGTVELFPWLIEKPQHLP